MKWENVVNKDRFRKSTAVPKEYDLRNDFEGDYGRVVFTPAVRRMHDKTQVFPLTMDDNIHSRLTHSLEVQTIARNMGVNVCRKLKDDDLTDEIKEGIPPILATVALCHDIGNPPFGHYGEESIQNFFKEYFKNKHILKKDQEKDFTEFDGNAQGFRVLTKLQVLNDTKGLNLTIGTLSAFLKYPFTSSDVGKGYSFGKKIGVFQSEKELLLEIRSKTGLDRKRNPLTFLMEAADNICYNVVDLEDGFNSKFFCMDDFYDFIMNKCKDDAKIIAMIDSFRKRNPKTDSYDFDRIVNLRIMLIGELVNEACKEFVENINSIKEGKFSSELLDKNKLISALKEFDYINIYKHRKIQRLELTGEKILRTLLECFVNGFLGDKGKIYEKRAEKFYNIISNSLKKILELETGKKNILKVDNYYKLRIIVDYIAGMTDSYALNLYRRLDGIEL